MSWPFKVLVKYTSRGRKERFFEGMETIYNLCSQPDHIRVLVTADIDDPAMYNDEVRDRIAAYKNTHLIFGVSESKIHAINRDFDLLPDEWKDWQILVNFSDDMRFTIFGWDDLIRVDYNANCPAFDSFFHYIDPDTRGALATLYVAGRLFFDRFGYVYHPSYKSLWADNEVEDVAKKLGKWFSPGYSIYFHSNPAYGHYTRDALFDTQQNFWGEDEANYYARKAINFNL